MKSGSPNRLNMKLIIQIFWLIWRWDWEWGFHQERFDEWGFNRMRILVILCWRDKEIPDWSNSCRKEMRNRGWESVSMYERETEGSVCVRACVRVVVYARERERERERERNCKIKFYEQVRHWCKKQRNSRWDEKPCSLIHFERRDRPSGIAQQLECPKYLPKFWILS